MIQKIAVFVSSKRFFYGLVGLLVVQAVWIALSGRYPMAFDEDFHLGIIRLYAHHISPFWSHQPASADAFGAVYRDPSYLYHYLMSFPYRLITLFTHDQTIQVIALRFMNIALFASCVPLYRRLMLKIGTSRTVTHIVLALFVILPIVPFLAAQINYDNLFLPMVALSLLLAVRINQELTTYRRLPMVALIELVIIGMLTSLVKYAFLPVLLALSLFLGVQFYRHLGRKHKFWITVGFGLTLMTKRTRWLLLIALIISGGLFVERYGINLLRYHEPVPGCDQVMSVQHCSAYAPYLRDYNYANQKGVSLHGPLGFSVDWLYGMWLRTFFAVDGPGTNFETRGPLLLPGITAIVLVIAGAVSLVWKAKTIWRHYDRQVLGIFIAVMAWYAALLWFDEYKAYRHAGLPVAINGRYLLPIMPLFMVLLAIAFHEALRKLPRLQIVLAGLAVVGLLWGGGVLTFIVRSRDVWYWPNHYVVTVNQSVQHVLYRIVPGAYNPIQFLR